MPTQSKVELKLRQWLRDHYGVISRYEAFSLGASADLIRSKLASGEWVRMHSGVYRDTAVPLSPHQDLRAAFVATRGFGVVSHTSAAWLWGLVPTAPRPELSIRTGTGGARRPKGVTIHRSRDLDLASAVLRHGFLVTNPLRTIVDLAGSVSPTCLADAVDTAVATRLVTVAGLTAELGRLSGHGRPGVGTLRRHLLDRGFVGAPNPSVLEAKAHRVIVATRLPLPTTELHVGEGGEYRLDIAWAPISFAIEVDGYIWHFSPDHKQRDDRRRNDLKNAGWYLLVYNWREVCNEPARLAREIVATYYKLSG